MPFEFWNNNYLGKGGCAKSDEFSEKCLGGEVPFNPKIDVADYGNFKEGFCSMKLIQKSNFRVEDMFFLIIVLRKIKTRQTLKKALVVIPYLGYSRAIKVELDLQKFDNMNTNGLSDIWKYPCLRNLP